MKKETVIDKVSINKLAYNCCYVKYQDEIRLYRSLVQEASLVQASPKYVSLYNYGVTLINPSNNYEDIPLASLGSDSMIVVDPFYTYLGPQGPMRSSLIRIQKFPREDTSYQNSYPFFQLKNIELKVLHPRWGNVAISADKLYFSVSV